MSVLSATLGRRLVPLAFVVLDPPQDPGGLIAAAPIVDDRIIGDSLVHAFNLALEEAELMDQALTKLIRDELRSKPETASPLMPSPTKRDKSLRSTLFCVSRP
jgi:hypothetical protein